MTATATKLKEHEACSLFPMIQGAEYQALKEDIRKNGLVEPLLIFDGKLVDGRNRLRACRELGIEPRFQEIEARYQTEGGVADLVMSLNFHRRHLTPHQRGEAIRQCMERHGGKKLGPGRPKKGQGNAPLRRISQQLGIPESTARRHMQAADDYQAAAPELRAKIDSGEITPRQAAQATVKVAKAVERLTPKDREDDAKIKSVYDRYAADHKEETAFLRWLKSTASGVEYWVPIFTKRKWDKATMDGIRADLARIAKGLGTMSKRTKR